MSKTNECIPMLKALADETRWGIVQELLKETLTVTELTERLEVSQYNVSKHLRILREAGIVQTEKDGKLLKCCIDEGFRQRVSRGKNQLDLGCCSFKFP